MLAHVRTTFHVSRFVGARNESRKYSRLSTDAAPHESEKVRRSPFLESSFSRKRSPVEVRRRSTARQAAGSARMGRKSPKPRLSRGAVDHLSTRKLPKILTRGRSRDLSGPLCLRRLGIPYPLRLDPEKSPRRPESAPPSPEASPQAPEYTPKYRLSL